MPRLARDKQTHTTKTHPITAFALRFFVAHSPNYTQPSPHCKNIKMQGDSIVVKGPAALKTCPGWHDVDGKMVPNLKSSGAKTNAPSFDLMLLSFSSAIDSIYNATVSFLPRQARDGQKGRFNKLKPKDCFRPHALKSYTIHI